MKPLSQSSVIVEEDAHELTFVFQYQSGWIELVAAPLVIAGTGILAWRDRTWWLVALCAAAIAWTAFRLFKDRSTRSASKLAANARELLVTLDLLGYPNRVIRFNPSEVKLLRYLVGGENQPSGLYLNDTCLFNGLDRQQAEAIASRIFYKFPNIGCQDDSPTSLLHGDDSGITSLGLTDASIPRKS